MKLTTVPLAILTVLWAVLVAELPAWTSRLKLPPVIVKVELLPNVTGPKLLTIALVPPIISVPFIAIVLLPLP